MGSIFLLAVTAILIENFVFVKFYGICPFLGVSQKTETAVGMGLAVTFTMTIASALTWPLYYFVLQPLGLEYLETIAFILLIACLVQFIEMFLQKAIPSLYSSLGIYLPLITTNCAVLSSALINIQNGYNFIESVCFGFAAAIGFTLAIVVFAGVRMRMTAANPPRAFKGFPITLIAAGLLAMAFSGFTSISL